MENKNKPQTKFPQKQTKLNQAEVENDYLRKCLVICVTYKNNYV
ncbi:hypothetical protein [Spiroplasma endosymbiont of Monopis laevigella]